MSRSTKPHTNMFPCLWVLPARSRPSVLSQFHQNQSLRWDFLFMWLMEGLLSGEGEWGQPDMAGTKCYQKVCSQPETSLSLMSQRSLENQWQDRVDSSLNWGDRPFVSFWWSVYLVGRVFYPTEGSVSKGQSPETGQLWDETILRAAGGWVHLWRRDSGWNLTPNTPDTSGSLSVVRGPAPAAPENVPDIQIPRPHPWLRESL